MSREEQNKNFNIDTLYVELSFVYPRSSEKIKNWIAKNINKPAHRWQIVERASLREMMSMILMSRML